MATQRQFDDIDQWLLGPDEATATEERAASDEAPSRRAESRPVDLQSHPTGAPIPPATPAASFEEPAAELEPAPVELPPFPSLSAPAVDQDAEAEVAPALANSTPEEGQDLATDAPAVPPLRSNSQTVVLRLSAAARTSPSDKSGLPLPGFPELPDTDLPMVPTAWPRPVTHVPEARPPMQRLTIALAGVAVVVCALWAVQRFGGTTSVASESFGSPIPSGPAVAPVTAPLPSQAASQSGSLLGAQADAPAATNSSLPVSADAGGGAASATSPVQLTSAPAALPLPLPLPLMPAASRELPVPGVKAALGAKPAASTPTPSNSPLIALGDEPRRTQAASPAQPGPGAPSSAAIAPKSAAPGATPAAALAPAAAASAGRVVQYGGESGILVLTAGAVVVFDPATSTQREVGVGKALPDGSIVKAVNPGRHRIETDRGVISLQ